MKTTLFILLLLAGNLFAENCIVFKLTPNGLECERTYEQKRKEFWIASTILAAGTIADIETTERKLDQGAREANPIMRPFAGSRWKSYAFRFGVNALLFKIAWAKDKPWSLAIAGTGYGAMAMWNMRF